MWHHLLLEIHRTWQACLTGRAVNRPRQLGFLYSQYSRVQVQECRVAEDRLVASSSSPLTTSFTREPQVCGSSLPQPQLGPGTGRRRETPPEAEEPMRTPPHPPQAQPPVSWVQLKVARLAGAARAQPCTGQRPGGEAKARARALQVQARAARTQEVAFISCLLLNLLKTIFAFFYKVP